MAGKFGEGAYGPTVMLKLRSPEAASYVRSILERLVSGRPGASLRLEEDPGVSRGAALWTLNLRVVADPQLRRLSRDQEGRTTYEGGNAVVVLNGAGEVITTWATHSSAWRIAP